MFYQTQPVHSGRDFSISQVRPWDYPLHMHRSFEMVCGAEGEICVSVDFTDYFVKPGEAVLVFPHQLHGFKKIGQGSGYLCIFAPELVGAFYSRVKNSLPENNLMRFTYCLEGLRPDSDLFTVKAFLYSACAAAFSQFRLVPRPKKCERALLDKILVFIEDNYRDVCTLENAAAALRYDYGYLSKYFMKNIGTSFNDYVNRRRVSDAVYMLAGGEEGGIGKIALECGYGSIRSFNRNFKKICGKTPKEYRAGIDEPVGDMV